MAEATTLGATTDTLQPKRWTWTRTNGRQVQTAYEGPKGVTEQRGLDEIQNPTAEWTVIDYVEDDNGGAMLTLTQEPVDDTGANEDGIIRDVWEVDRTIQIKPLRVHPFWAGVGDNIAADIPDAEPDPNAQKTYMDRVDEYVQASKIPEWGTGDFAAASDATKKYYYFRKAGVEGFNFATYVLRHIRRAVPTSNVTASHAKVNVVVPYPSDAPSYIGTILEEFEWLKQTPEIQLNEDETRDLIEEWWSGTPQWAIFYGGTWDPTPGGV